MTEHNLTRLHIQEAKDEETRQRNMRQEKVIIDLCGQHGKLREETLED